MLRNLRALLAAALLAVVTPAAAQQVLTNHALTVGRSPSIGLGAISVGTNGQVPLGQTGADPAFTTLSGDVTSIAAGGAVVVGKLNGVSGPSSGTSGGIPYYSSTSAMSSSALFAANQLVIGGGAGTAPATLGSLGTTTTLLHGNASGAPTFGAVVSGDLNITGTTCTNQFVTAISSSAAGTCTTDTLASAQHANQGTTTTVLHGNAAGNPSWGAVAIGTDVSGLGTGVATFLGTPSSANLASAITDETGSGAAVFASSPTLTTPNLGTPSAINLANGTALPVSGITSSTSTALGVGSLELGNASDTTLSRSAAGQLAVEGVDVLTTSNTKTVTNKTLTAPVLTGTTDNQGTVKLSSFVTSTQITAAQNDYTATDGSNTCSTKGTLRLSSDASRNITGLSCGQAEGDVRILHNVGSNAIVLTNQDAGSTAANRFLFGGDMTLAADTSVTIRYDGVTSRWRAITTPGAGGGGGGVTSVTVAAGSGINTTGTCTITTSGTCTVSNAAMRGYLYGLTLSNDSGTPASVIDTAAGDAASDDSSPTLMTLGSAYTKSISSTWTVGSGNGCLDTGTVANATYHVYIIKRTDTNVVDELCSLANSSSGTATVTIASPAVVTWSGNGLQVGQQVVFSTTGALPTGITAGTTYYVISAGFTAGTSFEISATQGGSAVNTSGTQSGTHTATSNPTMPANYTVKRRIGSILRESASIVTFSQNGDEFLRNAYVLDVNANNPGTSAVTRTLSVPIGIKVNALGNFQLTNANGSTGAYLLLSSPDVSDQAPSNSVAPLSMTPNTGLSSGAAVNNAADFNVRTNTSAQIRSRVGGLGTTDVTLRIATLGWIDTRGRL